MEEPQAPEMIYSDYLQLDKILEAQKPVSGVYGKEEIHEEHLFIIIHQAYELWFKQMIREVDSVKEIMGTPTISTVHMLKVTSRLNRVVLILKILVDQISVLETMTPVEFLEFRGYLSPASGFQSLQFRLLENKLGVRKDLRINYAKESYNKAFTKSEEIKAISISENETSLRQVVQRWLERTPGLEENGFNFWQKYKESVQIILKEMETKAMKAKDTTEQQSLMEEYEKKKGMFNRIFDVNIHNALVERGERRFSHKAFQGALMIFLYKDEPRFNQPFHLLTLLTNIDSLIMKWRYNHSQMVQKMIGSQLAGTGGSSGYQYLRATIDERYKVFLDLFNMATYLIPKSCIPPLTTKMKHRLSFIDSDELDEESGTEE